MTEDIGNLTADLLGQGYCIVRGAASAEVIAALDRDMEEHFARAPFCQGNFYGEKTKRFGALLRRSALAALIVRHRKVLAIVEAVLGRACDRIVLNLTQAIELHPGALAQVPHRDQDLWGVARGDVEYQVNVIWPLTPFTADNGATLLWPGSHRAEAPDQPEGVPVAAEMAPGDALLFLGSIVHGGGGNRTEERRRCLLTGYCLGWLRTFENQYLVYPPDIARTFDPELAALVGYAQHRPNLGNVEGQCPSRLLREGTIDGIAAIDALRPDQEEALARYVAEQHAAGAGLLGG
ncbi:phytanoyl-CoA dioxygenase family protein [Sphingomonas sp.]|uniref:phytanoyl-CoA dioxygenase family protein n=1 Tax=Sphingomonas sp. TaxID=28214 RepID=UPI0025CFA3EF|nr:phytanoyl-CoA dioxygenase family protein [Sphingomonas sp.]